ncbi:MAG: hypothetical protein COU81_02035 [Candidatus Portnoybacteria bacterium CG10_big_fil_rev_8_21_14_0_10_36_7]|uniref:Septum formation initiator n=1 Tax=Candidatus Portnoybacteria bacterium CG10_big_fil_rev_8_21_14_0_10_36_7 TaxID=1974812 RepID=A0A2M8KE25_9BACT|nr:MAG: hypothetical protein COU81_02035 [Candidatus Portnoybacteria bacterium CG10_big_fil_rev_8_21_14_0_10_36_7]
MEWNKLLSSKIVTYFLILAVMWTSIVTIKRGYSKWLMSKELKKVEDKIKNLGQSNEKLVALIKDMQDPSFLEKEARQKLNLQKEGESVVIVPKEVEDKLQKLATEQAEEKKLEEKRAEPIANWLSWIYYFIGKK